MIYANGRTVVNGRVVPNGPPVVCSSSRTDSRPICRSNSFPILFSASFDTWNVCRRVRGDVATLQNFFKNFLNPFQCFGRLWSEVNVPECSRNDVHLHFVNYTATRGPVVWSFQIFSWKKKNNWMIGRGDVSVDGAHDADDDDDHQPRDDDDGGTLTRWNRVSLLLF